MLAYGAGANGGARVRPEILDFVGLGGPGARETLPKPKGEGLRHPPPGLPVPSRPQTLRFPVCPPRDTPVCKQKSLSVGRQGDGALLESRLATKSVSRGA